MKTVWVRKALMLRLCVMSHFCYQRSEVRGFKHTRRLTKAEREMDEACLRHLRCFVLRTTRATNDYADRTVLIYLLARLDTIKER